MKYLAGLMFALLMMSVTGFSQDNYLDMKFGVGIPVGDFSNKELETTGYAGPGFMMSFEGNYFLGVIGFSGSLTYGMNFLDDVALQNDITQHLQELFPDVELPPDAKTQFVISQWSNVNALVGPVLSLPVVPALRVEVKAMGGVSFVMPPTWQLYIQTGDGQLHSESYGQSVKGAYLLGAGITYKSSGTYGIHLGMDYVGSKTNFKLNYAFIEGDVENPPYQTKTVKIPVNMIQVNLGITYAF